MIPGTDSRRILVVEDDPEVLDAMCEALAEEGYVVQTATNGQEALDLLARQPIPALIVLDLTMPVMDGHEFLEHRARRPDLATIPVMVVSATIDANLRHPDVEMLRKPVDLDTLLVTIARRLAASDR